MNVLYLSYDGMTDTLGQSQVIPYLTGLSKLNHNITIISFEKPEKQNFQPKIQELLQQAKLNWVKLTYHRHPQVFAKLYDLLILYRTISRVLKNQSIQAIHARSYLPALMALHFKKKHGLKFIFDMRGFWADERVDGGLWNLKNPLYWLIYKFFKHQEKKLILNADQVICLTQAAQQEMSRWSYLKASQQKKITVIPCCVDLNHFNPQPPSTPALQLLLEKNQLNSDQIVITYIGSIGTWYLTDEMLNCFKVIHQTLPQTVLLILTPDAPQPLWQKINQLNLDPRSVRINFAQRHEVPLYLSLSHLGLFFIKPCYSKIGSSATKLAEYLSMQVPVISNRDMGDHNFFADQFSIGYFVANFNQNEYQKLAVNLKTFLANVDRQKIRKVAEDFFSLDHGVLKYHHIYKQLEK